MNRVAVVWREQSQQFVDSRVGLKFHFVRVLFKFVILELFLTIWLLSSRIWTSSSSSPSSLLIDKNNMGAKVLEVCMLPLQIKHAKINQTTPGGSNYFGYTKDSGQLNIIKLR